MTKRVLFINEFGRPQTHFSTLQRAFRYIAKEAEIDATVFTSLAKELRPDEARLFAVEAPPHVSIPRVPRTVLNRNFAETTFNELFVHRQNAYDWMRAWDRTFRDSDPDLIIVDHAPVAQMVARGRWPVVAIGSGYTQPPATEPHFMTFGSAAPKRKEETKMLEAFNISLKACGATQLSRLTEIYAAQSQILACVPPLDPYLEKRPNAVYSGLHHPGGSPWPRHGNEGVFAYFHEFSQSDEGLLEALKSSGLPTDLYAGLPTDNFLKFFENSKVKIHQTAPALRDVLPGKSVCIHMGGLGVTTAALFAGVPQVMLHTHHENRFNARVVSSIGAAIHARLEDSDAPSIRALIHDAANDETMRRRAFVTGNALAQYRDLDPAAALAREVLAFLSSGRYAS